MSCRCCSAFHSRDMVINISSYSVNFKKNFFSVLSKEKFVSFVKPALTFLLVNIYVSPPHEMGRHIVFSSVVCLSVCLSVRLSVCPSHSRVRSIFFEPLVGITNNFSKMSAMLR